MQAMILAAGFGTRMAPLSDTTPKATLPLMGRPLIAHTLEWLARHGVKRTIINLHHLPETVREVALAHAPDDIDLRFVREPDIRGTGGGLVGGRSEFEPGPIIVVNGDIYTDMDLSALVAAHAEHDALATLALNAHPDQFELFSVGLAGDAPDGGPITDFWGEPSGGDPKRRLAFTGVHIMGSELV
ncbi:MAG: mannose-1-phosphate guanylyltransferase, partial [Myxococcota bacterium]